MSYDIWLEADCGNGPIRLDILDWNYTSNMVPAWCHAGADLFTYRNKPAKQCISSLVKAIQDMKYNEEWYAKNFNAANGWGNMETLIPALEQLLEAFEEAPDAIVRVYN